MCNTPPLFQGMTTSPSPIVRLYPAYSKLLKLTATSNAGGRSLVRRHVWYHLDRLVQFIYTSLFTRWQQQHIKAKTKTPAHQIVLQKDSTKSSAVAERPRHRAMLRVIEHFTNSLKDIQDHWTWHSWERREYLLLFRRNCICLSYRFLGTQR